MFFGALGEFALGQVPAAGAPLTGNNAKGIGALGEFALGEQGEALTGATVSVTSPIMVTFIFNAPAVASGAAIYPTSIAVKISFNAPAIAISATVTVPAPILVGVAFNAPAVASGGSVHPPTIPITFTFNAPAIRSGALIVMPSLPISIAFPTPEITARKRRVKSQAIQF